MKWKTMKLNYGYLHRYKVDKLIGLLSKTKIELHKLSISETKVGPSLLLPWTLRR